MDKLKIGFAMCGSFCTFSLVIPELEKLALENEVFPIMSEISSSTDTRFGKAENFKDRIRKATNKEIISTIPAAEPIGPKKLLDILVVAPCTGNTLSKLANAITDSTVTMAVKAHLRNNRPVVIAVSTNDALSGSAKSIGTLMNCKNIYFVPLKQDDPLKKPTSLVADFSLIGQTIEKALKNEQIQPLYLT